MSPRLIKSCITSRMQLFILTINNRMVTYWMSPFRSSWIQQQNVHLSCSMVISKKKILICVWVSISHSLQRPPYTYMSPLLRPPGPLSSPPPDQIRFDICRTWYGMQPSLDVWKVSHRHSDNVQWGHNPNGILNVVFLKYRFRNGRYGQLVIEKDSTYHY